MTREQNFRTSFSTQFSIFTGFRSINPDELKTLPLSEFPAFSIEPGKTTYTTFDMLGKATQGEQEFILTAYYALPLRRTDDAFHDHSDVMNLLERFINDPVFLVPPLLPGDPERIDRVRLISMMSPSVASGDTRYVAEMHTKYLFTIF